MYTDRDPKFHYTIPQKTLRHVVIVPKPGMYTDRDPKFHYAP
jgi:hypothetical protein